MLAVKGEGAEARFADPAVPRAIIGLLRTLREQLNAHCPTRESGQPCTWAKSGLSETVAEALSGPSFAAISDLLEVTSRDETARRELERFATYALSAPGLGGAVNGALAAVADLLQLAAADGQVAPILRGLARIAAPTDSPATGGAIARTLLVTQALFSTDDYDRYHVLGPVLAALVAPVEADHGGAPLDALLSAFADIHRADASLDTPLDEQDYRFIFKTAREVLTDETRGFEQLYAIVQRRPRR